MTDDEHPEAESDSGKTNPADANREPDAPEEPEEPEEDGAADLSDRVLCPDGACIGIIGPNGRCKVCGTPLDPSASKAEDDDTSDGDASDDDASDDDDGASDDDDGASDDDTSDDDTSDDDDGASDDAPDLASRVLCSDGACIGVVGPNGRCKECGKPYSGEEPAEEPADEPADEPSDADPADD